MKGTHVGGCALVLTLLCGCASTEGLEPQARLRDAKELPATSLAAGLSLSPAHWPAEDWWRALGDPRLDALVQEALRSQPSLETVDARRHAALAQAGAADAARDPRVTAAAQYVGSSAPEALIPPPTGGVYSTVEVLNGSFSWTPDLWGGQRAAWEAALGSARAAEVEAQAARIALAGDVAAAYVQLDLAYAQAEVSAQELRRLEHTLDLSRQRVTAGLDSLLQQRQFEAAVPAARQQLEAALLQIHQSRLALAALLGAGPDRAETLPKPEGLRATAPALPGELPAELLGHRADLVAARWRVEAASRGIAASTAKFYPNLSITAFAGLASDGLEHLFEGDSGFYGLAPALSLPLFDSRRLRAELAGSDADYELAVAQYNETLVKAVHEVASAAAALGSLQRQLDTQQQTVELSRQTHALALQRYSSGIGNYLEALSAQEPLLRAEQTLAQLRSQQLGASIQLAEALGGGYAATTTH